MSNLAVLRKNKLWQFRLPADAAFVAEYPDIVEQQNMLWEARMRDINEQFALTSLASPTKSRRRKESEASTASTDVEGGDSAIGDVVKAGGRRRRNSERGSAERPKDGEPPNSQNRKKAGDCGNPETATVQVDAQLELKTSTTPVANGTIAVNETIDDKLQ
ncbi:unnamed protein product, partial [Nesidiocoris tenuis]